MEQLFDRVFGTIGLVFAVFIVIVVVFVMDHNPKPGDRGWAGPSKHQLQQNMDRYVPGPE